eukprot:1367981-Rhodomonas_salina.1
MPYFHAFFTLVAQCPASRKRSSLHFFRTGGAGTSCSPHRPYAYFVVRLQCGTNSEPGSNIPVGIPTTIRTAFQFSPPKRFLVQVLNPTNNGAGTGYPAYPGTTVCVPGAKPPKAERAGVQPLGLSVRGRAPGFKMQLRRLLAWVLCPLLVGVAVLYSSTANGEPSHRQSGVEMSATTFADRVVPRHRARTGDISQGAAAGEWSANTKRYEPVRSSDAGMLAMDPQ